MNKNDKLEDSIGDYVLSALKGGLGAVPFVGGLLAEFTSSIVPNQRIDRIAKYAKNLEIRLTHAEQDLIKTKIQDDNFSELFEESIRQAARSTTEERRSYISSLIKISLSDKSISDIESRHLLKVLGELNDIEILILRSYLVKTIGGDNEFHEKHKDVITTPSVYVGAPQHELDKYGLHKSYIKHLSDLGLLEPEYKFDEAKGGFQRSIGSTGKIEISTHNITIFGRLLLRFCGFNHESLNAG